MYTMWFFKLDSSEDRMTKPKLAVSTPTQTLTCPNCWEPYEKEEPRRYMHPTTGELVPSVTTVISGGVPQPWGMPWAARMAAEHATANWLRLGTLPPVDRIYEMKNAYKVYAEEKASIGNVVHDLVDAWSTGRPGPDPPREVDSYINKFIDFLTVKRPEFIENEVTLFSRTYGYAGTADFIVKVDDKVWLADLKTGKSLHSEIGLQLAALANCDFILREDGTEEPIPEIEGLAGLHLRPRSWKFTEVGESDSCFATFLAAKNILEWTENIAPKVL